METIISVWKMASIATEHLRVVVLCGKPGVGKTFAANASATTNNTGIVEMALSEDTVVQELFGHYVPRGGEFIYRDGPVVDAMRNGKVLVINELSRASRAVQDALLAVLDSKASAHMTLPNGDSITAHDSFRAIITSNDSPDNLDPALRDRCEAVVNLTEPHPGLVVALNQSLSYLGDVVRESYSDADRAISTRASFAFAKLIRADIAPDVAAALAYGERADDILQTLKLRGVVSANGAA